MCHLDSAINEGDDDPRSRFTNITQSNVHPGDTAGLTRIEQVPLLGKQRVRPRLLWCHGWRDDR
jgi:hypothetical protein